MVDSIASTANLSRIKNNVKTLRDRGESVERIREYVAKEGVTADQLRSFAPTAEEDVASSAASGLKSGTEIAGGTLNELERLPGRAASSVAEWMGASPETVKSINDFRLSVNPLNTAMELITGQTPGMSPGSALHGPSTREVQTELDKTPLANLNYDPQTDIGRYAKSGVEGATSGLLTGGRRPVANMIAGSLSGVGSEAGADLFGDNVYGRTSGGLIGGVLPAVFNRFTRPAGTIPPDRMRANREMEARGQEQSAGQYTGNKFLQFAEQELGGGALDALVERQKDQFVQHAARNAGMSDMMMPTAENLRSNLDRIRTEMDTLAGMSSTPMDSMLENQIVNAVAMLERTGANPVTIDTARRELYHLIDQSALNGGVIDGQAYQNFNTLLRDMAPKLDPAAAQTFNEIRDALDDAVGRNAPPGVSERWTAARNQYRNQLILEDAVARGPTADQFSGHISPARLGTSADTIEGTRRTATESNSPMTELATSTAKGTPQLTSSNTAVRSAMRNPLQLANELLFRAPAGAALMSGPVQDYLKSQGPQIPSRAALATMLTMRRDPNEEGWRYRR